MNITNFKFTNRFGSSPLSWSFRGTVDTITVVGFLFWKSTNKTTREIYRNYGGRWYWSDTGEYVSNNIDELVRAWEAENECLLEEYVFLKKRDDDES